MFQKDNELKSQNHSFKKTIFSTTRLGIPCFNCYIYQDDTEMVQNKTDM